LTQVLLGLLMSPPAYQMLSGGRLWSFETTYHRRLLFFIYVGGVGKLIVVDFSPGVLVYFFFLV